MAAFRFYLGAALVGAIVGLVLATLAAPTFISSQLCGMTSDAMTSRPCLDTVQRTIDGMIHVQGIGSIVGACFGLGIGIAWRRRKATAVFLDPKPPAPTPPT